MLKMFGTFCSLLVRIFAGPAISLSHCGITARLCSPIFIFIHLCFAYTFSVILAPFTYLRLKCQTLCLHLCHNLLWNPLYAYSPNCNVSSFLWLLGNFLGYFLQPVQPIRIILFSSCSPKTLLYQL